MQAVYVQKLKETLSGKVSEYNRKKRSLKCDRSKDAIESLYDLATFCAPFDLKEIDEDIMTKFGNGGFTGQKTSLFNKKPMSSDPGYGRYRGTQEIAFLR